MRTTRAVGQPGAPVGSLDHVRPPARQAGPRRARARRPRPVGARADLRPAARQERRRAAVQLHRRPGHGQQVARRAHGVGAHAQGRLPALQGAAGLPPALPERLRLPGPVDRGRRRARARPELEARDRGVRAGRVRAPLPGRRGALRRRAHRRARSGSASGWTGAATTSRSPTRTSSTSGASCRSCTSAGWLYRGHRSTEWCPRCGTSISAHELAGSYVDREDPSLSVRFPLRRPAGPGDRHLDHHAVDAAGQRGRRRVAHRHLRAARQRRLARRRAQRGPLRGDRARARSSSGCATRAPSTPRPGRRGRRTA